MTNYFQNGNSSPGYVAIHVDIPIRTTTGLNVREHWAARAKRVKRERAATLQALLAFVHWDGKTALLRVLAGAGVVSVALERVSPREADEDNAVGGLKSVRDEVSAWLGVDDGDPRIVWSYSQSRGPFAVRVTILADGTAAGDSTGDSTAQPEVEPRDTRRIRSRHRTNGMG